MDGGRRSLQHPGDRDGDRREVVGGRRTAGLPDDARLGRRHRTADSRRRHADRGHVLAGATGKDLAALSDAARYTHHSATAWRALLALRARFPRAAQARDAAFFLGGLAEGDDAAGRGAAGQHALDWYNRYLRECPSGRFIGAAWGRKMVLPQRQRGVQAARPIAEEYLRRFPSGPYVAAARKVVQAPE